MSTSWLKRGLLLAALSSFTAAARAQDAPGPRPAIMPVQRIITFTEGLPAAQRVELVERFGGTVVHQLKLIHAVAAQFPPERIQILEASLKARPEVVRIEKDFRQKWIEAAASPAFPAFPAVRDIIKPLRLPRIMDEADPEVPWGIARVNAAKAWAVSRGEKAKVVVIDTGIDYDHSDLQENVEGGWNATNPARAFDFKDDNGHGTHVSGTIAAVKNSTGVVGVAHGAQLYGVKVLDSWGSGTFADVIAGIDWAVEHGMHVANMSLGASQGTEALAAAVLAAEKAGLVIIAAAGNSGGPVGYPAAYPETIAVSALDQADGITPWSSHGPQVALIAPGDNVLSTYMGGGFETLSGTSMATPHVAGLAALAVSAKGLRGREAVLAALKAAATPVADLTAEQQGAGVVDAEKLVQ